MDDLFPDDAKRSEDIKRARKKVEAANWKDVGQWVKDRNARWERRSAAKQRRSDFMLVIGDKLGG